MISIDAIILALLVLSIQSGLVVLASRSRREIVKGRRLII